MSPLTDVTNTNGHEPLLETQCRGFQRRRNKRISRSCPRIPCLKGQCEVEPAAIKMCNIQVSDNDNNNVSHPEFSVNCQCSDPKVQSNVSLPPQATDILLSHAVQTLNLSQNIVKSGLQPQSIFVQQRKKTNKVPENKQNAKTEASASCSGLPETPDTWNSSSSTQQCGACGLEFTSLPVLTQHLAWHVYDGLYAAQWLTQAMHLLVSRQPSSVPFSDGDRNRTSDILENSSVD